MTSAAPTQHEDRAVIVDVIRGFALIGVLISNFTSYIEQQLPEQILNSISSPVDTFLMSFNTVFFEWKFMTLFSILFGYGFGLILESVEKKNINPNFFFIKRMFWLFVFGVIHCMFWWGDVLNLYAMSGILLLLFRKKSTKSIFIYAVLCMFIVPVFINWLLRNQPDVFTSDDIQQLYTQYKQGSLTEVFNFNIHFYYRMFIISGINLHDIVETLGRFLFGYFLLRIKFFNALDEKKDLFRKIIFTSTPIMISYFILRWLLLSGSMHYINPYLVAPLLSIGILSTTACYVSLLVTAYIYCGMTWFFKALQALGRMTLTNYLLISAFLVILLYGFGFNKLGEISIHTIWLCAAAFLVFEITFSSWWLKQFRYGPAEWVWRQLTYWKRLSLRK